MKYAIALFLSMPAGASVYGRLDLTSPPAIGAWQSVEGPDQAVGLSKRVFHVDSGSQELVRLGVFAGVSKPLASEPSSPARPLGGATFAVPGSLLDFALGTNLGSKWLPKLKTGILGAYDLTRINALHWRPSFIGLGIAYPVGGE